MASLEQLKQTFFDECAEGMQQIELGLSDMREGLGSDDTINAVFRAVHSVKGGAGIFGFESLVGFAHVFETTLDSIRRGDLAASTDVIDTLLAASDVLSDLVQIVRAGDTIPAGFGDDCRGALERLLGKEPTEEEAPADFDGLDFVRSAPTPPTKWRSSMASISRPCKPTRSWMAPTVCGCSRSRSVPRRTC